MALETPPLVRACIMECQPYVAGRPREEVQKLLGHHDVIKLASNENALGPSPAAMAAVSAEVPHMHYYPDDAAMALREHIAERWGLKRQQVLTGNGSMQLLELLCKTFLNEGEEVIAAIPSFRVFGGLVRAAGGWLRSVPLRDHVHDLEAMAAAIGESTKIVIVCNPNNPTGTVVRPDDMRAFLKKIPPRVVVVLDEAYAEFCQDGAIADFREMLELCPTAIVLRSFSKIYGLAGLRLGYAMASVQMIDYLQRARMPFVANRLALVGGLAAYDDFDFVRETRANNFAGMERMRAALGDLAMQALPSQTNFLCIKLPVDDRDFVEKLMRQGVIVFPGSATDMPGYIRVTVGRPEEVERFLGTARRVLQA
jgi:histidinol-phosphate aminotransferase